MCARSFRGARVTEQFPVLGHSVDVFKQFVTHLLQYMLCRCYDKPTFIIYAALRVEMRKFAPRLSVCDSRTWAHFPEREFLRHQGVTAGTQNSPWLKPQ